MAACYVAKVEQWVEFTKNWGVINDREKFGVFHMADFVAKQEQFAKPEWQNDAKRDRTIRSLISIIKTRTQVGLAAAVQKSAYDEVITGNLRKRLAKNHYTFAIRLCTGLIDRWRAKHGYTQPVQYVFDRLSKGRGDIDQMFGILVSGKDDALRRYGVYKDCWSFQDKAEVVQLQAADIWAYENYRYMVDCIMPWRADGGRRKLRGSYKSLRDFPVEVRYHVKPTLEKFVRMVDQKSDPLESV